MVCVIYEPVLVCSTFLRQRRNQQKKFLFVQKCFKQKSTDRALICTIDLCLYLCVLFLSPKNNIKRVLKSSSTSMHLYIFIFFRTTMERLELWKDSTKNICFSPLRALLYISSVTLYLVCEFVCVCVCM